MRKLLVIGIVGLAAQLVDGALGMAYGVTSSSLMLAVGLSPAAASASVHLSELGTTLVSGAAHWRFGNVDWRMVLRLGVPGAVGAFAGATFLSGLSTEAATPWMAAILLVLGLYVLLRFTFGTIKLRADRPPLRSRFLAPLGLVAGSSTPPAVAAGARSPRRRCSCPGASSPARSSARSTPASSSSPPRRASASSSASATRASRPATSSPCSPAGCIAAPLAAYLVRRIAPKMLGSLVGGIIVLTNSRTLVRQFEITGAGAAAIYLTIVAGWIAAVAWSATALRAERAAAEAREAWIGAPVALD